MPRESVTSHVEVGNSYNTQKNVGVSGEETTDESPLAEALFIEISSDKDGSDVLYGGGQSKTLRDFFDKSPEGIMLSTIEPNATNTYYITVTFNPQAGNETQNLESKFDFTIGFSPLETISEEEGGGGGGDGGVITPPYQEEFEIYSVSHTDPTAKEDEDDKTTTITWNTREQEEPKEPVQTYGGVVYGPNSVETEEIDFQEDYPYYNYENRENDENEERVSEHSVEIENLDPGEYHYRVTAWHSPEKVSQEGTFTIPEEPELPEEEDEGEEGPPGEEEDEIAVAEPEEGEETTETPSKPAEEPSEPEEGESPEPEQNTVRDEEEGQPGALANLFAALGEWPFECFSCLPWWLLFIAGIYPAYLFWLKRKKHEKGSMLLGFWTLVHLVLGAYCGIWGPKCISIFVFGLLIFISLILRYFEFEETKREKLILAVGMLLVALLLLFYLVTDCLYGWVLILAFAGFVAFDFSMTSNKREENE